MGWGDVRQYIFGMDISLVMCVGVLVVGGGECMRPERVSRWGGTTPEQEEGWRWREWAETSHYQDICEWVPGPTTCSERAQINPPSRKFA